MRALGPADLTFTPPFGLTPNAFAVLELVTVGLGLGLWLLLLAGVLAWTRPADVDPLPAGADFPDDLPPAVVSLLANRWRLNEDAAEATLLDLAARRWIELRQPGNDPNHTTVHVLPAPTSGPASTSAGRLGAIPLTPYDEQVLAHVRSQAVQDVVPVTALTFRDQGQAGHWTQRLHSSVIEDARARGLTRRRFSPGLVTLLSAAAVLPSVLVALAAMSFRTDPSDGFGDQLQIGAVAGVIVFVVLSGLAGRPLGERDTPLGREVAARWLGLRTFLRNDEAFAELPPAAVAVWDRYLSYGDALGVTRVCSALLDLGMGDRKRVWSSLGGWHRVRVRYPRVWGRYGATALRVGLGAFATLAVGVLFAKLFGTQGFHFPSNGHRLVGDLPLLIALYLVIRGLYRLARLGLDLAAPQTVSGEVLWVELWKQTAAKEDSPSVPLVHYLAVDDGKADRTTAWALPSAWSERGRAGDGVTMVVRPWTRRVVELTVDSSRAAARNETPPVVAGPTGPHPAGATPADATGATAPAGQPLLTAGEVSAALGRPVLTDATAGRYALGPFEMVVFSEPDRGRPVLMLAVARGRAVSVVMRTARRGTQLSGVGDEAWQGPDWVAGRRGESMLRINLQAGSGVPAHALPGLLTTALARLP
jgi:hypothetical protein